MVQWNGQQGTADPVRVLPVVVLFQPRRNIPALFAALIICAYTDRCGRRIGLALPCLAGMFKCVYVCLALYFVTQVEYLMIGEIIEGLGGSIMTAQSCANLYLSDVLTTRQLAFRFMLIQGLHFLATSIGNVSIGFLIKYIGYSNSFWTIFAIYALGVLYILLVLPESVPAFSKKPFNLGHVLADAIGVFKIYIRKGRHIAYTNVKLSLMLMVVILDNIVILGRNDVDILYMLGSPFCWSSVTIGYFQAVKYLLKGESVLQTFNRL